MAISFVQYDDSYGSSSDINISSPSLNITTGNFLVVIVNAYSVISNGANVLAMTDTAGNTYHKVIGAYYGTTVRQEIWYANTISGNTSNIVTAYFSDVSDNRYISVAEFSGIAHSSGTGAPLVSFSTNTQNSTSHTSGNAVSTEIGQLIIGGINCFNTENFTLGTGFTSLSSDLTSVYNLGEYKILGAAGSYDASCTTSSSSQSIMNCAIFDVASETNSDNAIMYGVNF